MTEPDLSIEHRVQDRIDVVTLRGDLDLVSVPRFDAVIAACTAVVVVVDLSDVGFIDSAGLRALDRSHRTAVERHGALGFVAPDASPVRRTLDMVGFPAAAVASTVAEAIARRRDHGANGG